MLEKFRSKLNWKKLIENYQVLGWSVEAFLRKYEDRIPVSDFKDSALWRELPERKKSELKRKLLLVG